MRLLPWKESHHSHNGAATRQFSRAIAGTFFLGEPEAIAWVHFVPTNNSWYALWNSSTRVGSQVIHSGDKAFKSAARARKWVDARLVECGHTFLKEKLVPML